ncbi:MAG: sulfite exporter TauE/SafE family protein [Bacteroidota bacterium]
MIGAFVVGLVGSLHCVGMCGPVMIAFNPRAKARGLLLYHGGRLLSYLLIGLLLGGIGSFLFLVQIQQIFSLFLGLIILLLYGVPSVRNRLEKAYYNSKMYRFLRSLLTASLSRRQRWFLSGVANGFFPCGLVYLAAAGAVATAHIGNGAAFMFTFGLGTLPALLILQLTGNSLINRFRSLVPKALHFVAIISGLIMLYRGTVMQFPDFDSKVREEAINLITICGF